MTNKILKTAILVIILDQLSKFLFKNYFNFTRNYGAAFGLFQGYRWLFVVVAAIVVLLIFRYKNKLDNFALGLLLGGTIGNLIDRLVYGYVIDFIDFGFWPSFNLADSFSVVAAIILIYKHWKD